MKYTLLVMALLPFASFSQITITSSDLPDAGDSVKVSVAADDGGSDLTLTGANHTWDYSALIPDVQRFEKFDSPTTFSSPFNLLFNPFNTSYGRDNYQYDEVSFPGMTISDAYDFFKESSSSFRQIGVGFRFNGTPIPMGYSEPDTIHRFPMNYLDVDSCDYKYGAGVPDYGYYGQSGHRLNTVDGWGTLITPYGTFSVLRVVSRVDAVDTIYYDGFGLGTTFARPPRYEFRFMANGMKIPVLFIGAVDPGSGTLTVTDVYYKDSTRSGVPQVGIGESSLTALEVNVYPNPASASFSAEFAALPGEDAIITLRDVTGRLLLERRIYGQGGMIREQVSLVGVDSGIYVVTILSGDWIATRKLVVR